ncbi:MAG: transporter [Leptolyngbyaceae cyanobacterium bins.59]|nr:transporter [Leptolyngbyaceae cyanobacterium bins.59]
MPLTEFQEQSATPTVKSLALLNYSFKARDLLLDRSTLTISRVQDGLFSSPRANLPSGILSQQPEKPENQPPPDKSQYTLFNPTPRKFWRSFNPSRPSKTDSPFTVDAGAFQIESDLVTYTRDFNTPDGTKIEAFTVLIPVIRVGLLNNVDFQVQAQTYNHLSTRFPDGSRQVQSGYGDTIIGVRVNFWGNDGGKTAFGMVTSVKFPTNQDGLGNNAIEGGITLPLAIQLSDQLNLGLQTAFTFNKNSIDPGYNVGFINSASLSYQITPKLGAYGEIFTSVTTERNSDLVATFDLGVTYLITENFQIDSGINIGLTKAADDLNPFIGFSVRF